MRYTSLDTIVRGFLLQKGYTMHFYIDCLAHAARCFEELHFDTLHNVRTVELPVNSYNAVPLPCDYMDFIKVGVRNGQYIIPLSQRESINNLNNFDSNGNKIPWVDSGLTYGPFLAWSPTAINDKGEYVGKQYGLTGQNTYTFRIITARKEIQLDDGSGIEKIILEYISDGNESDNATMVSLYAKSTIEAYINWKIKEGSRAYNEGDRMRSQREFDHQHRILRGRLNSMTITDIKKIMEKNTHGSIK